MTVFKQWKLYVAQEFPEQFVATFENEDTRGLAEKLASVDWEKGDRQRGFDLYHLLRCAQCHEAGSRLGPRLEGIGKRFSKEDLFRAIVSPHEQVPERYRALMIETVDGQFFSGTMIYESVDGITLQDSGGNTLRINRSDIETRTVFRKSIMPEGLLKSTSEQDWADLYSFLSQLK